MHDAMVTLVHDMRAQRHFKSSSAESVNSKANDEDSTIGSAPWRAVCFVVPTFYNG